MTMEGLPNYTSREIFRDPELLSSEDVILIKQEITKHELELSELTQEISTMESLSPNLQVLDHLRAQKQQLEAWLDLHKSLFAPIRQLPRELLEAIFVEALSEDWRQITLSKKSAPWNLTAVSARFRNISTTSPKLWRSFSTPVLTSSTCDNPKFPLIVMLWLIRSAPLPLQLCLDGYIDGTLLTSFLSVSERWKHIVIRNVDMTMDLSSFLETKVAGRLKAPLLHTVEMDFDSRHIGDSAFYFRHLGTAKHCVFRALLAIKSVKTVICSSDPYFPTREDIPVSKLESYSILTPVPPLRVMNILKLGAESLQELNIGIDKGTLISNDENKTEDPIELPVLRKLVVSMHSAENCTAIFDRIVTPALKSFELVHECNHAAWDPSPLQSLLVRSGCRLSALHLTKACVKPEDVLSCLHGLGDEVEELSLLAAPYTTLLDSGVASALQANPKLDVPCLFPRLKRLSSSDANVLFGKMIADVVESRTKPALDSANSGHTHICSMEEVRVHNSKNIRGRDRLESLRHKGVFVVLT